jgi:UDP-glucose 4-epimerase
LTSYNLDAALGESLLLTGGAGFIASHLAERILQTSNVKVCVFDNLSSGNLFNLHNCVASPNFRFIKGDLGQLSPLTDALKGITTLIHAAADPEVRTGYEDPTISFNQNIKNTFTLLDCARKSDVKNVHFFSSSTVYGEPLTIPTTEGYGPLFPISHYGASKLACEAYVSSFSKSYGFCSQTYRLANIVGQRSRHGVIWDFITKLRTCKQKLEILGSGEQTKSYLHVSDCVGCILFALSNLTTGVEILNVGNSDRIDVLTIAKTICEVMGLNDVQFLCTGGVDDGAGWKGDVKFMQLDISKLIERGWSPKLSSKDAVVRSSKELLSLYNNEKSAINSQSH